MALEHAHELAGRKAADDYVTEAFHRALDESMAADPNVILLGEDIGDREGGGVVKVTKGLSTKYGDHRVRTTPIAEEAIIGAAMGLALAGMRPVAEIMLMNFVTVAMDKIVNHAAKLRFMSGGQTSVPITIRTSTGAGGGTAGQHSDKLEAWFAHVPGMKVVVPSSPADAVGLLASCIFDDDPCLFIEDGMTRAQTGPAPPPGHRIPLGKANIVRAGTDVSVISYGRPIRDALAIAERLAGEGISVEVVDLRTVSPMDTDTVLKSVAKTRRAVIVHEAPRSFGVGAEVSARINEHLYGDLAAPVLRVASRDVPVPFAKVLETEFLYKPSAIEASPSVRLWLPRHVDECGGAHTADRLFHDGGQPSGVARGGWLEGGERRAALYAGDRQGGAGGSISRRRNPQDSRPGRPGLSGGRTDRGDIIEHQPSPSSRLNLPWRAAASAARRHLG